MRFDVMMVCRCTGVLVTYLLSMIFLSECSFCFVEEENLQDLLPQKHVQQNPLLSFRLLFFLISSKKKRNSLPARLARFTNVLDRQQQRPCQFFFLCYATENKLFEDALGGGGRRSTLAPRQREASEEEGEKEEKKKTKKKRRKN